MGPNPGRGGNWDRDINREKRREDREKAAKDEAKREAWGTLADHRP